MISHWELLRHNLRLHGLKALAYAQGLSAVRYAEYATILKFLDGAQQPILDAGSGHSPFPSLLAARGHQVVSLDFTPQGPRWQHAKGEGQLEAMQASLTALPFADNSFAAALAISVLEHIDEDGQAMAELARVVKPKGLVIVSVGVSPQSSETNDLFFAIPRFYRFLLGPNRLRQVMGHLGVDRGDHYYERFYDRRQLQERLIEPSGCVLEDWSIFWDWGASRHIYRVIPKSFFTPLELVVARLSPRRPEQATHLGGIVLKLRKTTASTGVQLSPAIPYYPREPVLSERDSASPLTRRLLEEVRGRGIPASSGADFMGRTLAGVSRPDPKVLIIGSYGVGNAGDDAILSGVLGWIRAAQPGARVWVPSHRRPELVRNLHGVASDRLFSIGTFRQFLSSDALVVGGGSLFDREMPTVSRLLPLFIILAKVLRKRVALTSLGFYRGYPWPSRWLARLAYALADGASVRDPASWKQTGWARHRRVVEVVPDPSTDVAPAPAEECRSLLRAEGVNPEDFLIGLQLRYLKDEAFNRRVVVEGAKAADALVARLGARVVFFPMDRSMTVVGPSHGDHILAEALRARLRQPDMFCILRRDDYTPAQLKGMMGQMQLFIGMRLISLYFAYALGLPTVAIPYSDKVSSLLEMLGEEGIPLDQFESQRLVQRAEAALARHQASSGNA